MIREEEKDLVHQHSRTDSEKSIVLLYWCWSIDRLTQSDPSNVRWGVTILPDISWTDEDLLLSFSPPSSCSTFCLDTSSIILIVATLYGNECWRRKEWVGHSRQTSMSSKINRRVPLLPIHWSIVCINTHFHRHGNELSRRCRLFRLIFQSIDDQLWQHLSDWCRDFVKLPLSLIFARLVRENSLHSLTFFVLSNGSDSIPCHRRFSKTIFTSVDPLSSQTSLIDIRTETDSPLCTSQIETVLSSNNEGEGGWGCERGRVHTRRARVHRQIHSSHQLSRHFPNDRSMNNSLDRNSVWMCFQLNERWLISNRLNIDKSTKNIPQVFVTFVVDRCGTNLPRKIIGQQRTSPLNTIRKKKQISFKWISMLDHSEVFIRSIWGSIPPNESIACDLRVREKRNPTVRNCQWCCCGNEKTFDRLKNVRRSADSNVQISLRFHCDDWSISNVHGYTVKIKSTSINGDICLLIKIEKISSRDLLQDSDSTRRPVRKRIDVFRSSSSNTTEEIFFTPSPSGSTEVWPNEYSISVKEIWHRIPPHLFSMFNETLLFINTHFISQSMIFVSSSLTDWNIFQSIALLSNRSSTTIRRRGEMSVDMLCSIEMDESFHLHLHRNEHIHCRPFPSWSSLHICGRSERGQRFVTKSIESQLRRGESETNERQIDFGNGTTINNHHGCQWISFLSLFDINPNVRWPAWTTISPSILSSLHSSEQGVFLRRFDIDQNKGRSSIKEKFFPLSISTTEEMKRKSTSTGEMRDWSIEEENLARISFIQIEWNSNQNKNKDQQFVHLHRFSPLLLIFSIDQLFWNWLHQCLIIDLSHTHQILHGRVAMRRVLPCTAVSRLEQWLL